MAQAPKRGKLFWGLLGWFLVISLGPAALMDYFFVRAAKRSLRDETERMQESMAVGFQETVSKYVDLFKSALDEEAKLDEFSSMSAARERGALEQILQVHKAFLELSVLDASGMEKVKVEKEGEAPLPLRNMGASEAFAAAYSQKEYVGGLGRYQGIYPTVLVAVAIPSPKDPQGKPLGVLLGKVSLVGLSKMLNMEFPPPPAGNSIAAVVAPDGFLIAHSDPNVIYKAQARLPDKVVKIITTQINGQGGGEIDLDDGEKVLGAYSYLKEYGWAVYVQEPIETAYRAVYETSWQSVKILLWTVLGVLLASLAVAEHIASPVRVLQEAAARLGRGEFDEMPDLVVTNDEIGYLAQTFKAMSDSLKEKTDELVGAKSQLEQFTKTLEERVKSRTRELKAAQEELIKKERLAAVGQMASVVGHEIRNPLAVINNSVYFIKTKLAAALEADPKIAKHVKIIESEIQQANGIINEILTYSRQRDLKLERVSLDAFVDELLTAHPIPPQIRLIKELKTPGVSVDIDTTEVRQAIRNLIGNAVEVMPDGGALRVRTAPADDQTALVEVADSGPGMPAQVMEKIFMPFFTTKARGTGLGLAVVKKAMDRHGGKVEVESAVGKGTAFRLYIPMAKAQTKAPQEVAG